MAAADLDSLLSAVKLASQNADEAGRKKIADALRDLSYTIESPQDSMQRLMYTEYQLVATRVGCDLNLFRILTEGAHPMTTAQIAEKCKAAPVLLNRLLRFLASYRLIQEVGHDEFTANEMTKTITIPGFEAGIYHYSDIVGPCLHALPGYLKEHSYREITELTDCPLQKGHNTKLPFFKWLPNHPDLFAYFNSFMEVQRMGMPTWLDVYPYSEKAQQLSPEQVFFVDIGGGVGHQCVALRKRLPVSEVSNRVVLQDMSSVLEQADNLAGVEIKGYDFWKPQDIKGAKIYYMRNIIHDYPDEKAVQILQNTKVAMTPDSVLLIDDMIIPDEGAHWQATQIDLTMMIVCGSIERTKQQWTALMERAGFKIQNVYQYTMSLSDSIIECVPA